MPATPFARTSPDHIRAPTAPATTSLVSRNMCGHLGFATDHRRVEAWLSTPIIPCSSQVADHMGDVVYVYLGRIMGTPEYYRTLVAESQDISALMVEGQHRAAMRAIRDFFRRRITEVTRTQAKSWRMPAGTNPTCSPAELSRLGGA